MIDPFERTVREFIHSRGLLPAGGRVAAAVSGGPDSTALLLALRALSVDGGFDLTAFHYNHRLRPDSHQDEEFVRDLCRRLEVVLEVGQGSSREQAQQMGWNLEDWARRVRYRALIETALRRKADIASGHTLDDQAETVLLKLVRGAGPEGLSAISPRRLVRMAGGKNVAIVRPLLSCRRQEVLDYLKRCGQGFRRDDSNADLSLDRNWVRAELVPLLEGRLNPNLAAALGRSARLWGEAGEWLKRQADEVLQGCTQEAGDLLLPLQALAERPEIVQRTALREAVVRMRDGDGFEPFSLAPEPARKAVRFAHIEALLGLLKKAPGRQVRLPARLRAVRERDRIRLTRRGPTPDFCYRLLPPGEVELKEVNKRLSLQERSHPPSGSEALLWLDSSPLAVRNRRPGDRYRVGKAASPKKLKDLMTERGVPNAQRDRLIVLESRGRIVWVEGFPPHPDCKPPASAAERGAARGRSCFEILLKLHNS